MSNTCIDSFITNNNCSETEHFENKVEEKEMEIEQIVVKKEAEEPNVLTNSIPIKEERPSSQNSNSSQTFELKLNYPDLTTFKTEPINKTNHGYSLNANFANSELFNTLLTHFLYLEKQFALYDFRTERFLPNLSRIRKPQTENGAHYNENRNYQTFQQNVLIALINKYADVCIRKERKRATVSYPFFNLASLAFSNEDRLLFDQYVQKRCVQMKEYDLNNNVSEKTAVRRYKTNRITEIIHTLIDFLRINGEYIKTKQTRYQEGIRQTETFIEFKIGNKVFGMEDIKTFGKEIDSIFSAHIECYGEMEIPKGYLYQQVFIDALLN